MKQKRFGLVVAGMHRSGTSAATGALQRLGIVLGDDLMAGADDNPKGYFEHEAVVGIHDELLRELGSWWSDPRALPEGWLVSPAARRAEERLVALLRRDFSDAPVWAIKDPRACRLLPLWRRCLDRLKWKAGVLHVVRSPTEVAASLTSRNGFSRSLGELLWLRHVSAAIRDSSGLARTVLLYESLLADPPGAMQRALASLGVTLPTISATGADSLEGFVDPGFRHHSDLSTVPGNCLSELAGQMFQGYRDLAAGGRDWRALEELSERFELEWGAMEPLVGSVAESVFPELDSRAALQAEVREVRSQLNAQVAWSEQAVIDHASLAEARDQLAAQLHEALLSLRDAQAAQARLQSDLAGQARWAEEYVAEHRVTQEARDSLAIAHGSIQEELHAASQALSLAQAERARLESELTAQVRWAEQAVVAHRATADQRDALAATRDELIAQRHQAQQDLALARAEEARLRNELNAQLQRNDQAAVEHRATVEQRDALAAARTELVAQQHQAQQDLALARAEEARLRDELNVQLQRADQAAVEHRATVEQRDTHLAMLQQALKAHALAQDELARARADVVSQATRADSLDSLLREAGETAAVLRRVNAELQIEGDVARQEISALRAELTAAADSAQIAGLERARLEAERARFDEGAERLRNELALVKASRSWRWTAPLRSIVQLGRPAANSMSTFPTDDPAPRPGHSRTSNGAPAENQIDSGKENKP